MKVIEFEVIIVLVMHVTLLPQRISGFGTSSRSRRYLAAATNAITRTASTKPPRTCDHILPSLFSQRCRATVVSSSLLNAVPEGNNDYSLDVRNLLGSALRRSLTTISEKDQMLKEEFTKTTSSGGDDEDSSNVAVSSSSLFLDNNNVGTSSVLKASIQSAENSIKLKRQLQNEGVERESDGSTPTAIAAALQSPQSSSSSSSSPLSGFKRQRPNEYHGNPAITNIALAQALWSTILIPNVDSAIDATCGNGNDSIVLAKKLFGDDGGGAYEENQSQLMCLDIQKEACQNTTQALTDAGYGGLIEEERIQVLQQSHAPLPSLPTSTSSVVGLVVYNLGWLPKSDKKYITKLESTLESIVDAMLLIRKFGMVSVITYPKTNSQEDVAVRLLLECAALLSSKITKWDTDFLMNDCNDDEEEIKQLVHKSMIRLIDEGHHKQTWRVSQHTKLGMDRAPILITATRIK